MSKQKEKRFSWVLKRFSFLQEDKCYSPTFVVAGCNWRLLACHKGDKNGYLSLYLELVDPEFFQSGWRREVKFRLTLVNKIQKQSTEVLENLSSQVQSVSHIFKRHPDIALGFRPKNQQIRRAYMDALLSLIEMLCKSPEKLSEDDLRNADDTLVDLIDAGLKVDWLKTKLNEVSEKKKTEQGSKARLQTMEEQLQKLKHMFLDLESQLQKEKAQVLAMRAPLSFKDVVY